MNSRFKKAFLVMVVLQAVHSLEGFVFKFDEAFPPMRFVYQRAPDLAKPTFIAFNLLLISFGFFCFFYWVRPARKVARVVAWVWVWIQLATVVAHVIWWISTVGYHPGLATAPLFVPAVAYMVYLLRHRPASDD